MNLKHLLRLSFAERMDAYTRLRAEGKITMDDVAQNENMVPEPMTDCVVTREKVEARIGQRCPKCLRLPDRHLTLAEKVEAAWDAEAARLASQERRDKEGTE